MNNDYIKNDELLYREQVLAERRKAKEQKLLEDLEIMNFHAYIADMIEGPQGSELKKKAIEICDRWEKEQMCSAYYIDEWRRMLSMSPKKMRKAMLREESKGIGFRQNSPFFSMGIRYENK